MRKFKRALSSVLAFVMVISIVTVMNVVNVFAEDVKASSSPTAAKSTVEDYVEWTQWNVGTSDISAGEPDIGGKVETNLESVPTLSFVGYTQKNSGGNKDTSVTAPHKTYTTTDTNTAIKTSNASAKGIAISNAYAAGKGFSSYNLILTINSNAKADNENLKITLCNGTQYDKNNVIIETTENLNRQESIPGQVTFTGLTAENIYITVGAGTATGNQANIYSITLDYISSEPSVKLNTNAETIAINDSIDLEATVANIPDVESATWTVESGNNVVDITPSGNKCTVKVKSTATAEQTATIKATAGAYSDTATITVRDAINKTWDFSDVSWQGFSLAGDPNSPASTVNDDLTVGFVDKAATNKIINTTDDGRLNLGTSGSCYFEYTAPGNGTLVYSIINSGITKDDQHPEVSKEGARTLKINNSEEGQPYTSTGEFNYYTQIVSLKKNETYRVQGGSNGFHLAALQFVEEVATVTEPETGIIQKTNDLGQNIEKTMPSSNVGVYYAGEGNYYAVSVIPGNDIEKYSQVKQKSGYQQEVASSDTVYTKVDIDGEKTAVDFGGKSSDYVYASKIEGATGVGADILVKAITSVLVPVAE